MNQLLLLAVVFLSVLLGVSLGAALLRGFLALVAWMIPPSGRALPGRPHDGSSRAPRLRRIGTIGM